MGIFARILSDEKLAKSLGVALTNDSSYPIDKSEFPLSETDIFSCSNIIAMECSVTPVAAGKGIYYRITLGCAGSG